MFVATHPFNALDKRSVRPIFLGKTLNDLAARRLLATHIAGGLWGEGKNGRKSGNQGIANYSLSLSLS